ncbi:MAG: glycoside hydrolase family 15 protein [Candidatus Dojkabacteria bacterium]
MSIAKQISSDRLLINIDYEGDIVDLCWPIKGADNLLLRDKIEYFLWEGSNYLAKRGQDVSTSASYEVSGDNIRQEIEIVNNSVESKIVSLYLLLKPDFGSNKSRDCVLWDTINNSLIFYERGKYLSVQCESHKIEQFACHSPQDNNSLGALPDKHGNLSNNPVATGEVEASMKVNIRVKSKEATRVIFLYALSNTPDGSRGMAKVKKKNELVKKAKNIASSLAEEVGLNAYYSERLMILAQTSAEITIGSLNENGSIFAAVDSTPIKNGGVEDYSYMWGRDAALTIMSLLNFIDLLSPSYVRKLTRGFDFLATGYSTYGFEVHRFHLDQPVPASTWHEISNERQMQIDQLALVLIAYDKFKKVTGNSSKKFERILDDAVDFLSGYVEDSGLHKPCFDLWENHFGQFLSEQIALTKVLEVYGRKELAEMSRKQIVNYFFDSEKNSFTRGNFEKYHEKIAGDDLDASFHWLWQFEMIPADHKQLKSTIEHTEKYLRAENGGYLRYVKDFYLLEDETKNGNPWYITTLWFAQYYLKTGDLAATREAIEFVLDHMEPTGLLPEMAEANTGLSLSVRPLVWSHVELLNLLHLKESKKSQI